MKETWRWFGPQDPISLPQVKQTGATGVVTALHHFTRGERWPLEEVLKRKGEIESAGCRSFDVSDKCRECVRHPFTSRFELKRTHLAGCLYDAFAVLDLSLSSM